MYRFYHPSVLALVALPILAACSPQPEEATPLEGAWEMVSATYTDADTTMEVDLSQVKILTDSRFAFGRQNEASAFAGGGRYEVDDSDSTYTEIVEYHSDPLAAGERLVFKYRLEGDSLWYHSGNIGPDFYLEEVWRRVE